MLVKCGTPSLLLGCAAIILNRLNPSPVCIHQHNLILIQGFLHVSNLGTQSTLGCLSPNPGCFLAISCKILFWRNRAYLSLPVPNQNTRKSLISYRVVDGITPPAILQKYNWNHLCHSEKILASMQFNTTCILSKPYRKNYYGIFSCKAGYTQPMKPNRTNYNMSHIVPLCW